MISKEKLKELIKQEATVYYTYKLCDQNFSAEFPLQKNDFIDCDSIKNDVNKFVPYLIAKFGSIGLDGLYETKEEAEFVAKYHCSTTIKFEPPTFEKFYNCYSDSGILIDDFYEYFQVGRYEYGEIDLFDANLFNYEKDNIESKKQTYYQAVEYAKKLFLGII